jgi:signal transduction histidine kinase
MFDLYRPNQDLIREFLIDDTIREIVALLKVSYSRRPEGKIDIEVEKGDPSLAVVLPEGLVRQVLYNLIQNAIDASPTGEVVRVAATVAQDILTIKVSDRGSGIPKEMHSQIFEPFFTTKYYKGRGGLGLGLSISKNLVEAMRGSIDFNSEADQGTVFRVTLPIRI